MNRSRVDLGNVRGRQGATGKGIIRIEYLEKESDDDSDVLRVYYSDHTATTPSYDDFEVIKPIIPRTDTVNNNPLYKDYLPTNKAVYDALTLKADWNYVYSKTQTIDKIKEYIKAINIAEIVTTLPTTNIDTNKFYFKVKQESNNDATYDGLLKTIDVYVYVNEGTESNPNYQWQQIDVLEFNIKDYYTKTQANDTFAQKNHTHGNITKDGEIKLSNSLQKGKNVVTDSSTGKITTEAKPTIPTNVSQLNNDANYVTITEVNGAVGNIDLTSKEDKSNKVSSWSSPTNTGTDYANNITYPSEKLVKTELDKKADVNSLSTVATSGSYTDLSNKPSFTYTPTITSSTSNSYKLGSLSFGDNSTDIYAKNIQVVSSNTYPSSSNSEWYSLRITGDINKTIGSVLAVAHTGTKSNAGGAKLEVNGVQEPIYHNGTPINGGIINPHDTVFFVYSDNVAHLNSNIGLTSGWELWGMYSHPSYTARTGRPKSSDNLTPSFGETFTVTQFTSDTLGHISGATDRTITIPSTTSSGSAYGLAKASSTSPKMNGTATVGSEVDTFARGDHIHPSDSTKQDKSGLSWTTETIARNGTGDGSSGNGFVQVSYNDYLVIVEMMKYNSQTQIPNAESDSNMWGILAQVPNNNPDLRPISPIVAPNYGTALVKIAIDTNGNIKAQSQQYTYENGLECTATFTYRRR